MKRRRTKTRSTGGSGRSAAPRPAESLQGQPKIEPESDADVPREVDERPRDEAVVPCPDDEEAVHESASDEWLDAELGAEPAVEISGDGDLQRE